VRQTKGERNYHIFYNVTNGMPATEQAKFHLHRWDYFDYLNTTGCHIVDGVSEEHEFTGFRVRLCTGTRSLSRTETHTTMPLPGLPPPL